MKRAILAVAGGLFVLGQAFAAPRPEEIIPERFGEIVTIVPDVPKLLKDWDENPILKTWEDPQVKKFLGPLRKRMEVDQWSDNAREATGASFEEWRRVVRGSLVLAVGGIAESVQENAKRKRERRPRGKSEEEAAEGESEGATDPFEGILIAEVDAKEYERLLPRLEEADQVSARKKGKEIRRRTEEFQGETLHIEESIRDGKTIRVGGWVLMGNKLFSSNRVEVLKEVVSNHKRGGAERSLAGMPQVKKARARPIQQDILICWDPKTVREKIRSDVPPEGRGPDPEKIIRALGLDAVEGVILAVDLEPEATRLELGLVASAHRGIMNLLALRDGAPSRPAFTPEDAVAASSQRISLPGVYAAIQEILNGIDPMMGAMLQMPLFQLKGSTGIDFEKDFLGNIGDELFSSESPSQAGLPVGSGKTGAPADNDLLLWVPVKDAQALGAALVGLKNLVGSGEEGEGAFTVKDYLGTPIHTFKNPLSSEEGAQEKFISYAIAGGNLFVCIGTTSPLQAVIRNIGKPVRPVWEDPEVLGGIEKLPPGCCGVTFTRMEALLTNFFREVRERQERLDRALKDIEEKMGPLEPPLLGFCDPSVKLDPREAGRFFGMATSGLYRTADGIFMHLRVAHR